MALLALGSFVVCSIALVAVVIAGGPIVWFGTAVITVWVARRVWHWLCQSTPVSNDVVLPMDNPTRAGERSRTS